MHRGEPRNVSLDSTRALAALTVVMLHVCSVQLLQGGYSPLTTALSTLCGWGVPFFFFLSGYLQGTKVTESPPGTWRRKRVTRIALPYLVWSAVYVIAATLTAYFAGASLPAWNPLKLVFFAQANTTLWFLPAVLYCGLAASVTRSRVGALTLAACGLVLDLGLIIAGTTVPSNPILTHAGQALTAYAIAYFLGLGGNRPTVRAATWMAMAAALLLCASSAVALLASPDVIVGASAPAPVNVIAYRAQWVAGGLAFGWALADRQPGRFDRLARWGRYSLGVYASHTLFAVAIAGLVSPAGWAPLAWVVPVWVVTSAASLCVSWLLARTRITKPLAV